MIDKKQRQLASGAIEWAMFWARWPLFILAIALAGPAAGAQPQLAYLAAGGGAFYNLVVCLLLLLGRFSRFASLVSQIVDVVLMLVLIHATGNQPGSFFLLSAIVVTAGSLRTEPLVGLLSALVLVAGQLTGAIVAGPRQLTSAFLTTLGIHAIVLFSLPLLHWAADQARREATCEADRLLQPTRQARSGGEHLRMINGLASTLNVTLNHERVLEALLDTCAAALSELGDFDPNTPRMALLFSPRGGLAVAASRFLKDEDLSREIPGRFGLVRETLQSAEATLGGEAAQDPELSTFRAMSGVQSLLCVPLRAGLQSYGAVVIGSSLRDSFAQEHVDLVAAFCNQAMVALQNARLYQSLQEEKQRIIDTQEESRHRLARELHDGPTQSVSAIAMRLNFTKLLVTREPEKAAVELDKLEVLARRTAKEIRMMLFTLRPVVLETQGLTAALEQYAVKLRETDHLTVHVESRLPERLSTRIEDVTFSIVEEAVNNARKHARAQNIYVRLREDGAMFVAEVQDDGKGFDVSSVKNSYDQRGSLGLINMRERASLINGKLTVDSALGKGTRILLVAPLESDGAC